MRELIQEPEGGVIRTRGEPAEARPEVRAREVAVPSAQAQTRSDGGLRVTLLTGGGDKPYALGMARALDAHGIMVDFIGSDDLDLPEVHRIPNVNFLNLRGDQRVDASYGRKALRILTYYLRLIRYAATARPRVFHILWNNRFEFLDRTVLMIYYRLVGKRIVFTAHNVNAAKRDAKDTYPNRVSLSFQYKMANHIFVHTTKMKNQLVDEFAVLPDKVSVIPLGINNTVPLTSLTTAEAKQRLGIGPDQRALLFFGRIAPYKGLEYLIAALGEISRTNGNYRLIIAGDVKGCAEYWEFVQREISRAGVREYLMERIQFIPDDQTELYFKAADVLVLPYVEIFQSGVLVLAYSFGLPVIAADVGSLRDEIVDGETGYVCRPKDPFDLGKMIEVYFSSDLFRDLEHRRREIRDYANDRYSWTKVGEITRNVYETLMQGDDRFGSRGRGN